MKRIISRAMPGVLRMLSTEFHRFFLLLESGDHLLLEGGFKVILG